MGYLLSIFKIKYSLYITNMYSLRLGISSLWQGWQWLCFKFRVEIGHEQTRSRFFRQWAWRNGFRSGYRWRWSSLFRGILCYDDGWLIEFKHFRTINVWSKLVCLCHVAVQHLCKLRISSKIQTVCLFQDWEKRLYML